MEGDTGDGRGLKKKKKGKRGTTKSVVQFVMPKKFLEPSFDDIVLEQMTATAISLSEEREKRLREYIR